MSAADQNSDVYSLLESLFILVSAAMVFFMNTGYAMIHVGSVQMKNTKNVLITNIFDSALAGCLWWLIGYGFSFGDDDPNSFIGSGGFALADESFRSSESDNYIQWCEWLLHWAVACTAVTITAGAVAERITWQAYAMYSASFIGFIYPVVVHWGWSSTGWASVLNRTEPLLECGAIDHAGSGVVHVTGGTAALVGAALLGSRHGRFIDGVAREFPKASWVYQTLGTLIIWFGWFGLILGINFRGIDDSSALNIARAMVNISISASASCLTTVSYYQIMEDVISTEAANNGILSGLVAISACCTIVNPEGAFVIGLIGGGFYILGNRMMIYLCIDDVVNATPVHFFAGIWGIVSPGLFSTSTLYKEYYDNGREDKCCGVFYGCGGRQLGASFVFMLTIIAWTAAVTGMIFCFAKFTVGLRIPTDVEDVGMDLSKHGGIAFEADGQKRSLDPICIGTDDVIDDTFEFNANKEAAKKRSLLQGSGLGTSEEVGIVM